MLPTECHTVGCPGQKAGNEMQADLEKQANLRP